MRVPIVFSCADLMPPAALVPPESRAAGPSRFPATFQPIIPPRGVIHGHGRRADRRRAVRGVRPLPAAGGERGPAGGGRRGLLRLDARDGAGACCRSCSRSSPTRRPGGGSRPSSAARSGTPCRSRTTASGRGRSPARSATTPCPCGSGKKYKKCCSEWADGAPALDPEGVWMLVAEELPLEQVEALGESGRMPRPILGGVATGLLDNGDRGARAGAGPPAVRAPRAAGRAGLGGAQHAPRSL